MAHAAQITPVGVGHFGVVMLAFKRDTSFPLAVKKVNKQIVLDKESHVDDFLTEWSDIGVKPAHMLPATITRFQSDTQRPTSRMLTRTTQQVAAQGPDLAILCTNDLLIRGACHVQPGHGVVHWR